MSQGHHRVVITGVGGISPLGQDWSSTKASLQSYQNRVVRLDEWDKYQGMRTRLGAPITDFTTPEHYTRKQTRSMGRVSLLATRASELALMDAGLLDDPVIKSGKMGIAYGSCSGSFEPVIYFGEMLKNGTITGITATSYIRLMSHTAPVNVGVFFGIRGRVYTTSSACTSSSQGIGYAYEAIKYGQQTLMLAGGAEELSVTQAVVFDTLFATSTLNDTPNLSPRPFDKHRDGLVIGEGAGTLILESLEHAKSRGAKIYAEIVGYGTNSDGQHITQPTAQTMETAIRLALDDANLTCDAIDYVNAHGTATDRGDIAESQSTHAVFGPNIPISSIKSYIGHTLGACGALEAWMSIEMMNEGWFAPTLNLKEVDGDCAPLDFIRDESRQIEAEHVMSNNFAFGGINTSLIFKRWQEK